MTRREFIPCLWQAQAALHLDLKDVAYFPPDLAVPPPEPGSPRPGHRVRVGSPELYYVLLLPTEWQTGGHYPVIVEYAGNGPAGLSPQIPGSTVESGLPDDTVLGYGISAGAEYIWASLPFIQPGGGGIAPIWWGDPQATSDYCAVAEICFKYGGDPQRLLLCGFSRGSIACNFIGLHDDAIAALWRGFFCHSHYDGVHRWPYAGSDRESALRRLQRLNGRPQFISHESSGDERGLLHVRGRPRPKYVGSVAETRTYLEQSKVVGEFTFGELPYPNHTDKWILRPLRLRDTVRQWVRRVMS
jgi:hypothetical protein